MSEQKIKRRWGDKKDGRLIRGKELDTNHFIMPYVWPRRTDNEAYISETIDLTAIDEYLLKKNAELKAEDRISLFTILLASMGKTFLNRPKMNRFYRHRRLYERRQVSIGFIVKKQLSDDGEEALTKVIVDPNDTLETFSQKLKNQIEISRSDVMDKSSDDVRILMKFPRFVARLVMGFMVWWDRHFKMPDAISATDLFFNSIVVTHLGSIGLHAGYHHLSNWGTNSFFGIIGEKKVRPFYDKTGEMTLKNSIDIGFTIDERIADGFYFSKTIKLMKKYFSNPELLEKPFKEAND